MLLVGLTAIPLNHLSCQQHIDDLKYCHGPKVLDGLQDCAGEQHLKDSQTLYSLRAQTPYASPHKAVEQPYGILEVLPLEQPIFKTFLAGFGQQQCFKPEALTR